ncbi:NAD+ synthase [Microbaculum marinum]|uniref:Glutamine-dependent NAD(+) synthetase n=1 Tax=Microbaculum marinum TaxID=1764581 RepID=A0AAW9RKZ0_9HYPH
MINEIAIACAQLNPIVGDVAGNLAMARKARAEAAGQGADLLVLTELFIAGYTPEDLVLKPSFVEACQDAVRELAADTADGGPAVLIGTPWHEDMSTYSAVCLLEEGKVSAIRYKVDLPNYGPFDEKRVFTAGPLPGPISFRGIRLGVPICEDIWDDEVVECLEETGAEILIVPNGSPWWKHKHELRLNIAVQRVTESRLPLIYVNQLGGQDELIFDGASFGLQSDSSLAFQMPAYVEAVSLTRWSRGSDGWRCTEGPMETLEDNDALIWLACVQGLRDYVGKTGFPGVVLGLSGGIDSAICAAIAVDALGPDRVHCVMLPYRYTSNASLADASACAEALGVRYDTVPIGEAVDGFEHSLKPLFDSMPADTTEENLQSRARGTVLMAISNKFGPMVVTTGNKSEMSVGYSTLYGDMNGGFNPIKDLYKTEVYRLAAWRNANRPKGCIGPDGIVIPETILTKAPTAELKPGQTDQDSLPPYDVLDDILSCLVEDEMSVAEIVARGHDLATVKRIENMLYVAEYKRRQAPPGIKITRRNFGRDRRYPIVNKYRDAMPAEQDS